jgi:hypothetical protein
MRKKTGDCLPREIPRGILMLIKFDLLQQLLSGSDRTDLEMMPGS